MRCYSASAGSIAANATLGLALKGHQMFVDFVLGLGAAASLFLATAVVAVDRDAVKRHVDEHDAT
ncbi:hypothetical protein CK489_29145 [Bradyrhizobium sp. UFLA03-84]|uniref:hypothetical protein n=1 Tax=Bradyrhizobium sp. UFLA03-84 TaxID=418599 RepID=UPI000BADDC45|nr:hypothetical protein [Bradyrhizobium sp. UFLA03-84]PAY05452.1 hypothetical protein CK489_29145 [Bradyrhizobium sp. UFLA03-84]